MVTGNFHATFDPKTYMDYVKIVGKGNVRSSLEKYMNNIIAYNNQDIDGINIKLIEMDIERLQNSITKLNAELQHKQQLREKYEENRRKNEENRLELEKNALEKTKKCANCGKILNEKMKIEEFPIGKVCNTCFMSAIKEDLRRWNQKI